MNSSYTPNTPIIFQTRQHKAAKAILVASISIFAVFWLTITLFASIAFTSLSKTIPEGIGEYRSNGTLYKRIGDKYIIGTKYVTRDVFIETLIQEEKFFYLFLAPFWIIGVGAAIATISFTKKTTIQEIILTSKTLYITKADLPEVVREVPTATIKTVFTNKTILDKLFGTVTVSGTLNTGFDLDEQHDSSISIHSNSFHSLSRFTIPLVIDGETLEEKVREVTA